MPLAILVASFTDAWIETKVNAPLKDRSDVASFTDAWIETESLLHKLYIQSGRIFYRCVD